MNTKWPTFWSAVKNYMLLSPVLSSRSTRSSSLLAVLCLIKNPTLPSFNEKIKGYEEARKTTSSTAFGNSAFKGNPNCRPPPSGQQRSTERSGAPCGRGEQDRRLALRGHCFRCTKEDHLLPHCTYPKSVKCNLCSATGHITPACSRRQNV